MEPPRSCTRQWGISRTKMAAGANRQRSVEECESPGFDAFARRRSRRRREIVKRAVRGEARGLAGIGIEYLEHQGLGGAGMLLDQRLHLRVVDARARSASSVKSLTCVRWSTNTNPCVSNLNVSRNGLPLRTVISYCRYCGGSPCAPSPANRCSAPAARRYRRYS